MGNYNRLNVHIGKKSFNKLPIADKYDVTCYSNCTLIRKPCDKFSHIVSDFITVFRLDSVPISCPIEYFNCTDNIVKIKKLISGFYVNQKLADGTLVEKPENQKKCSHGGIQDSTSFRKPKGGINKDSGFLVLSPHAHLHEIAASLAIKHTELFFNEIRSKIGDKQFSKFLAIDQVKFSFRNEFNKHVQICAACRPTSSLLIIILSLILVINK